MTNMKKILKLKFPLNMLLYRNIKKQNKFEEVLSETDLLGRHRISKLIMYSIVWDESYEGYDFWEALESAYTIKYKQLMFKEKKLAVLIKEGP